MEPVLITYRIEPAGSAPVVREFRLDAETLEVLDPPDDAPPEWARLAFHQCELCPLSAACVEHCPVAVEFADVAASCGGLDSFEPVVLEVVTEERRVLVDTTAQRALGSMLGLLMACSGCPVTTPFRPMARFHLPMATEAETIYRATSMYLLAQYFHRKRGGSFDADLDGLRALYGRVRLVNQGIAARLRAAVENDAAVGGVVILDMYAEAVPQVVDESLEEMEGLFAPFMEPPPVALPRALAGS